MSRYALGLALLVLVGTVSLGWAGASLAAAQDPAPQLVGPDPGVSLNQPSEGWTFNWKAPAGGQQVQDYQLWVGVQGSRRPLVDQVVVKPTFVFKQAAPVATGANVTWVWKVRAHYGPGKYGPWSEERPFKVEPAKNTPAGATGSQDDTRRPVTRPKSGTAIIRRRGAEGKGVMRVMNDTKNDMAVKLAVETTVNGKTRRSLSQFVYVRAGEQADIKSIPAGQYFVLAAEGSDWDNTGQRFQSDRHFMMVDDPFPFEVERVGNDVVGSTVAALTITEGHTGEGQPVTPIDESAFNAIN